MALAIFAKRRAAKWIACTAMQLSMPIMTSMTSAPLPPPPKVMTSNSCMGWPHCWRLTEANVAICMPTQGNVAAQKTHVGVVISLKPRLMSFKGNNILVGRHIKVR